MALELEHYCPRCDEENVFYRAASTTLHLGEKIKWHCPNCDYGFVQVNGEVDSSAA